MKRAMLALTLLACSADPASDPFLVVDSSTVSAHEFRAFQVARDRVETASGVRVPLAWGPCQPNRWCAVSSETLPDDKAGLTWVAFEVIQIEQGHGDVTSQIVLHEYLHMLGIREHVPGPSIMNEELEAANDCITDAELLVLCDVWACDRWVPEACP